MTHAATISNAMIMKMGSKPTASYIAPADSDPTMDAAKGGGVGLANLVGARPDIRDPSDQRQRHQPRTGDHESCRARTRMNEAEESTSGNSA